MANCCVFKCSNSYYQLQRWLQSPCDKHTDDKENGIATLHLKCECTPPFKLLRFPKDETESRIWIKNVNRKNWLPKQHTRICSEHFKDMKPTAANPYPVLKMGHLISDKVARKPPTPRQVQMSHVIPEVNVPEAQNPSINQHDHTYFFTYHCDCKSGCDCIGCEQKALEIKTLKNKIMLEGQLVDVKNDLNSVSHNFSIDSICKSDKKVRQYLGLPNKQVFFILLQIIKPKCKYLRYWKGRRHIVSLKGKKPKCKPGPSRKLSIKHEFLLTLLKLRLNLSLEFLSDIFDVSITVTSQILSTWIRLLSKLLKCLIYHPSRDEVKATLPKVFNDQIPSARGIIDCSEFFIETPSSLDVQALTWSDYKQHNTVKVLIDISPTGIIQFVSKAWGGRTSDKHIVNNSGYLDTLEPGDTILADRGFPIAEELLLQGAKLYIPPGARGVEQMTREKVRKTKRVANLRIHVERAINRLKWFRILSETIPISMVHLIDDIIIVCSVFSNLQPPLVK